MPRCFVRLPTERRTKIVVLPPAGESFTAFKLRCLAKVGLSPSGGAEDVTLLLDSNKGDLDVQTAPEVEDLDEISDGDFLIVLPSEHASIDPETGGREDSKAAAARQTHRVNLERHAQGIATTRARATALMTRKKAERRRRRRRKRRRRRRRTTTTTISMRQQMRQRL